MFKYIKFSIATILFFILFSCSSPEDKPLEISFSTDSTQIVVKNIDQAGLFQLKANLETDSAYQQLVSVLQTPTDDDSIGMEKEWLGKLNLNEDKLVFTPDIPFIKGKTYLVETILNAQFATGEDILKDKVGTQIRPQQKTLKR